MVSVPWCPRKSPCVRAGVPVRVVLLSAAGLALAFLVPRALAAEIEIREYQGQKLAPFDRGYDNSIKGPQKVDPASYRLVIGGMVQTPRSLTIEEVLALPHVKRALTLHCVEGWEERLLFEGVRLADLLAAAGPKSGVKTVIFHAVDGYTSSLTWEFVLKRDLMIASRVNGLALDGVRGFPFQVVAESKYGYKWVKWLTRIELSDQDYRGYWESRGYGNEADLP